MSAQQQQFHEEDDFGPAVTDGYKPGQKKSMNEYQTLDADDEALRRWKESLGITSAAATGDDPHNVVVLQLALEVAGRPDVVLDLTKSEEELKKHSFTIKEGVEYRVKVLFKVQHSLVSGLKYMQVVKRHGVKVDKYEDMIGSYAAKPDIIEKKVEASTKCKGLRATILIHATNTTRPICRQFALEEAPSGMLARGHYDAKSKFIDDDGTIHKEWSWSFDIKKDW
ncbi:hypothetical protein EDD11_004030 [Mortierella claussenii]|nr:hypothetical protein EDD11_004030 [Mortierella claussenii]